MIDTNKIYCGDSLDLIKHIDENHIKCIFTDPPYNIGYKYKTYDDNKSDYWEWSERWLKECYRILCDDGSIFVKQFNRNLLTFSNIMLKVGFKERNIIIWKNSSQANPQNSFLKEYEVIIFMSKSDNNYFNILGMKDPRRKDGWGEDRDAVGRYGDLWDNVKRVTAGNQIHPEGIYEKNSGKKIHSCQMPQELVKRAILHTTQKGDIVLDLFNGIGTTTTQTNLLGRKYIGFEIDETYNL
ncbi:MAG: hypothetical protein DRQ97_12975, partial [Gammaproteobacteria bacterium]